MMFNMGFGSFGALSTNKVDRVIYPASVEKFMSGEFVMGKFSELVPVKQEVKDYEAAADSLITNILSTFTNFQKGDPIFASAAEALEDISSYKDYLVLKGLVQNPHLTTPMAVNEFYVHYFGSYTKWSEFTNWLRQHSTATNQSILDTVAGKAGDVIFDIDALRMKFYVDVITPLQDNFSQDDQVFIQDNFYYAGDGTVSLDDLIKIYKMIAPYIDAATYRTVYKFSYQFILSETLGTDVFIPEKQLEYGLRNINAEVAEVTSKFNSVASRLGSWLDPGTGALFSMHNQNMINAYNYPNNPKYSVSPTANQINENFILAVTKALDSILPLISDGQVLVAPTTSIGPVAEARALPRGALPLRQPPSEQKKASIVPILVVGAAFWLLFGKVSKS